MIEAIARANEGYPHSYGADPIMDGVRAQIRDLFEAPDAAVYLVATGTAANALILATLVAAVAGCLLPPQRPYRRR